MASYTDEKNNDPRKSMPAAAQGSGRLDRPLGRGLEDVSHLFLSQPGDAAVREQTADRSTTHPTGQPDANARLVLLRRVESLTRDRLGAALRDFAGALGEGLRPIDANVPCNGHAEIDLIAIDRASRLTIVDFDTTADEGLLLRGLAHVDWVARNVATLRRVYQWTALNLSPPRLILVAPRFSVRVRAAARQMAGAQLQCVRYLVFDGPGGRAIAFQDADDD